MHSLSCGLRSPFRNCLFIHIPIYLRHKLAQVFISASPYTFSSAAVRCNHPARRMNMADPNYSLFSLLASIAGIASHLGYFIHGEHHMQSLQWLVFMICSPVILFVAVLKLGLASSYLAALKLTTISTTSFFTSLTGSILIYRIFFHPLRHFPGPFSAKVSKIFHALRLANTSDNYLQAHRLHEKYGDIVRLELRSSIYLTHY